MVCSLFHFVWVGNSWLCHPANLDFIAVLRVPMDSQNEENVFLWCGVLGIPTSWPVYDTPIVQNL